MEAPAAKPHKIHLSEEKETLLITLYAKALDSRSPRSVLNDHTAAKWVEAIDYDFEKLNSFGNGNIMPVRARQLDEWLRDFLRAHPGATVLNLGCGLDTRVFRVDPPADVRWFDVDYPEVIALRGEFCEERENYVMIGASVTDPAWLPKIPRDKPVMIVAEGLLEYLTEADVRALVNRLTGYFREGRIAFDVMNAFAIRSGKAQLKATTQAEHKWAVEDAAAVDRLDSRWRRTHEVSVFASRFVKKLPWKFRLIYGAMRRVERFRDMLRLFQYRF